jgi:hypothetical protein
VDARRDDITSEQRLQIVIEVLALHRPHGLVSELAPAKGVWHQTVYDMAANALTSSARKAPHN